MEDPLGSLSNPYTLETYYFAPDRGLSPADEHRLVRQALARSFMPDDSSSRSGLQEERALKIQTPLDLAKARIDDALGTGWVDRFTQAHGVDPVTFYSTKENRFPLMRDMDPAKNPDAYMNAAADSAIKEGQLHAHEVAEWQKLHGDVDIPDEQWQKWHSMNRSGAAGTWQGEGVNPWGVY